MTDDRHRDVEMWRRAKTLEDIGELTAKWIEGSIGYYPGHGGAVDSETIPLQKTLADYNRKGLVTTFSQPGELLDDEGYGQRACVEGYAPEEVAKRIAALGLSTDLLVLVFPPGDYEWGYQVPISTAEFHPFTWCGAFCGSEELECFVEDCSDEALESLRRAWKVVVIDLQWGRESFLWEHVSKALDNQQDPNRPFNVTPSPDLELDQGFVY